jgi:hypothetical protein
MSAPRPAAWTRVSLARTRVSCCVTRSADHRRAAMRLPAHFPLYDFDKKAPASWEESGQNHRARPLAGPRCLVKSVTGPAVLWDSIRRTAPRALPSISIPTKMPRGPLGSLALDPVIWLPLRSGSVPIPVRQLS